jgi:hypothetical protein
MDPDQPVHPRSLIRIYAVRLPTLLQVEKMIANSMDPDQTVCMRRLVWIHAGRKRTMLVLSWRDSSHDYINVAAQNYFLLISMKNDKTRRLHLYHFYGKIIYLYIHNVMLNYTWELVNFAAIQVRVLLKVLALPVYVTVLVFSSKWVL